MESKARKARSELQEKEKQSIAKLTGRPQFLQSTLAQLSSVQDGSAHLGSVKAVLRVYLKAAIFKPELPRTRGERTRGESNPRPRPATAGLRDNFQRPFREQQNHTAEEFARRHSESASTHTISAEGSSGNLKNAKNLEFLHLDHADLSRGHRQKRKTNWSCCTSTTPISAKGRIPDRWQHPHPPRLKRDSEYRALSLSFPRVKYLLNLTYLT